MAPGPRSPLGGHLPSARPSAPENDREWFAQLLKDQTDELRNMSDTRDAAYERRFVALEKSALESSRLAFAVEKLLESERRQEQDIGALRERVIAAVKPAVVAEASTEGSLAGAITGKRAAKIWTAVGTVLAIVISSAFSYCAKQIGGGALDGVSAPASSTK